VLGIGVNSRRHFERNVFNHPRIECRNCDHPSTRFCDNGGRP
jgi:hypothetical protein